MDWEFRLSLGGHFCGVGRYPPGSLMFLWSAGSSAGSWMIQGGFSGVSGG